jgi:hypothetical protein
MYAACRATRPLAAASTIGRQVLRTNSVARREINQAIDLLPRESYLSSPYHRLRDEILRRRAKFTAVQIDFLLRRYSETVAVRSRCGATQTWGSRGLRK